MSYWPGTNIRKSTGNAFDRQGRGASIASSKEFKHSHHSATVNAGNGAIKRKTFTINTKARKA